jgi:hypothetical protein
VAGVALYLFLVLQIEKKYKYEGGYVDISATSGRERVGNKFLLVPVKGQLLTKDHHCTKNICLTPRSQRKARVGFSPQISVS